MQKAAMFAEFDYVVPIGEACFVATFLKNLNVREFSAPFDWVMGANLETRLELILNEFKDFLNIEDLVCVTKQVEDGLLAEGLTDFPTKHEIYENRRTGISHNHDFLRDTPLEESFPEAKEKYNRRIERFLDLMRGESNILFFYADMPKPNAKRADRDKLTELMVRINCHFRGGQKRLLYFHHTENPAIDIKILNKYIELGEYHNSDTTPVLEHDLRNTIDLDAKKVKANP